MGLGDLRLGWRDLNGFWQTKNDTSRCGQTQLQDPGTGLEILFDDRGVQLKRVPNQRGPVLVRIRGPHNVCNIDGSHIFLYKKK